MRRTIRASTYYKWALWCGTFAGLFFGLFLMSSFFYNMHKEGLLPLYERGLIGMRDGTFAGMVILLIALGSVIAAMIISAGLTALKILDPDVETDDDRDDCSEPEMTSHRCEFESQQESSSTLMQSSRPF